MVMYGVKCKILVFVVVGVLLGMGFMVVLEVKVEGFVDDLLLMGGIYYW